MRSAIARIERLELEAGELVATHDRGRDLADFSQYEDDPVGFSRDVLGRDLWSAQRDLLEGIRDNRLFQVRSAHGCGKSFVFGDVTLWWLYARAPSLVVTLAATERQVKTLWSEIRAAWLKVGDLPGELFQQSLRIDDATRHYAIGFTGDTEPGRITGVHHERLLVLVDEAHELPPDAWAAVMSLAAGEQNRVCAIGNPGALEGPWYRIGKRWPGFRISALDHPNVVSGEEKIPGAVSRAYVQDMANEFGEDSAVYKNKVLGIEAELDELILIHNAWAEDAIGSYESKELESRAAEAIQVCGLDVARQGSDATVLTVFQDPLVREIVSWKKRDTVQTVELIGEHYERLGLDKERNPIGVEMDGLGAGVRDQLVRAEFKCLDYYAGGGARDSDRFLNQRAEAHWAMRERFEFRNIGIPDQPRLVEELKALRWGEEPSGKRRIEDKSKLKARLGRSPDFSDSLVVALWTAEKHNAHSDLGNFSNEGLVRLSPWGGGAGLDMDYSGGL